jgi:hypothetical protein
VTSHIYREEGSKPKGNTNKCCIEGIESTLERNEVGQRDPGQQRITVPDINPMRAEMSPDPEFRAPAQGKRLREDGRLAPSLYRGSRHW